MACLKMEKVHCGNLIFAAYFSNYMFRHHALFGVSVFSTVGLLML